MRVIWNNSFPVASLVALLAGAPLVSSCSDSEDDAIARENSSDDDDVEGENEQDATEVGATDHAHSDDEEEDDAPTDVETDDDAAAGDEASTDEDVSDDEDTWFVVPTQLYSPDFSTSTSYVPVVSSLDVDEVSIDDAKELNGRASSAVVGEWLFLASSSEPVVTRYTVDDEGRLSEDGRLNFSNYGVPEHFSIDSWGAVFVNEEKAYIFNGSDGSHIVWNPSTLEITGEIPGPDVVVEGYNLESVAIVRGDRMYRVFTALNYDTWEFLAEPQYMAVYDVESDELVDLVEETRCPQLYSRPFVDESGDIYFSGWVWTPGLTLTSDYPKSCALRVKSGEDDFDRDWQLDFAADLTDGREAGIMRYLGNGKALLDVFYDERADINDETDAQELSNTPNWRLWTVDLEAMTGAPVEGLDFKAGGYTDVQVDGRTFLMVPNENYSRTTAYEVIDGEAVETFEIEGSSYQMVRVR